MAQMIIQIPDALVNRVIDAVASQYGYKSEVDGTKAAFAKKVVIDFIKGIVRAYETNRDSVAARDAAVEKVNSEVTLS